MARARASPSLGLLRRIVNGSSGETVARIGFWRKSWRQPRLPRVSQVLAQPTGPAAAKATAIRKRARTAHPRRFGPAHDADNAGGAYRRPIGRSTRTPAVVAYSREFW